MNKRSRLYILSITVCLLGLAVNGCDKGPYGPAPGNDSEEQETRKEFEPTVEGYCDKGIQETRAGFREDGQRYLEEDARSFREWCLENDGGYFLTDAVEITEKSREELIKQLYKACNDEYGNAWIACMREEFESMGVNTE